MAMRACQRAQARLRVLIAIHTRLTRTGRILFCSPLQPRVGPESPPTRGYSCEQIHKSIIEFLPRKHAKSRHLGHVTVRSAHCCVTKQIEITSRTDNDIGSVRTDNLVWSGSGRRIDGNEVSCYPRPEIDEEIAFPTHKISQDGPVSPDSCHNTDHLPPDSTFKTPRQSRLGAII